jgi:hypothetical protein
MSAKQILNKKKKKTKIETLSSGFFSGITSTRLNADNNEMIHYRTNKPIKY